MERWLLSFIFGAVFSLFIPFALNGYYVIVSLAVAIFFLFIKPLKHLSAFFLALSWLMIHGLYYQGSFSSQLANQAYFFNKEQLLEVTIITIPSVDGVQKRFNAQINTINNEELPSNWFSSPLLIRLSWLDAPENLIRGQRWRLNVKLKPAHGFANTGSFSYQTWLRQNKLSATGYVKKAKLTVGEKQKNINSLIEKSTNVRQQLYRHFETIVPEHYLSPLIFALSFGERSKIQPELWQVLKATGTQHLIAISGLHLGLVASGSLLFFTLLLRLLPLEKILPTTYQHKITKVNTRYCLIIVTCCLTLFYGYLAGYSLPTLRAVIMLGLFWGIRVLGLKLSPLRWLLLTACLIIAIAPFSLFSGSFWLSLYAVSTIFFVSWRFSVVFQETRPWLKYLKVLLLIQVSLTIFMLPIIAIYSQQISLAAFLANIIAVPWLSFTSIPLSLLAVLSLPLSESVALFFTDKALICLTLVWQWLSYLSGHPWALISLSSNQSLYLIFAIGVLALVTVFHFSWRNKIAILVVGLMVFYIQHRFNERSSEAKKWRVTTLDVGHGLAVVIESKNKTLLYDTGPSYPSGFNLAESVLMPYFQHHGIDELDKVIISHNDNDHASGLAYLEKNITINETINNHEVIENRLAKNGLKYTACYQGQEYLWQGLTIKVLWPSKAFLAEQKTSKNDRSCVVQITDDKNTVLLTGDITKNIETKLLQQGILNKVDVLIAPHHGSKTSSSQRFVNKVNPEHVVFSTGFMNRWKMPNVNVVSRYNNEKVQIFNTADLGMIIVDLENDRQRSHNKVSVYGYRTKVWPFWFAN